MSWAVKRYDKDTGTWVDEDSLPNPARDEFEIPTITSAVFARALNGELVRTIPEHPVQDGQTIGLTFWKRSTRDLKHRLERYIKSGSGLLLFTHLEGETISGSFTECRERWVITDSGPNKQKFILVTQFKLMDAEQ